MQPTDRQARDLFAKAQAHHRAGQFGLAESHYLRLTKLDPRNADAWHLLGVVAYQMGKVDKAIAHYRRAVELRPRAAEMLNNLALALRAKGDLAGAAALFAQALGVRPEYAAAAYNLGLLHEQARDFAAAERAYRQALAGDPDAVHALTNLGNLLRASGRLDEAERHLSRAQMLARTDAAANGNLALLRIDQARHAQARELAETATRLDPGDAKWWEALGTALRLAQDADGALAPLQTAARLAPGDAAIHLQLALALTDSGDFEAAREAYARTRALAPHWPRARWQQALAVPSVPADETAVAAALRSFDDGIAALADEPAADEAAFECAQSVGVFAMHYLPGDHTTRQRRFGDLVGAIASAVRPSWMAPPPWRALAHGGRLRVGFVSAYLHEHVVERYFGGWIAGLDASRFERYVWYTGATPDARTAALRAVVDHYVEPAGSFDALAASVRASELDVLIYLDVGLDPRQQALAALRLAPVQCAGYGHPITTGLATIDCYLSGDVLEPDDAEAHYRERLVRLPGLGCVPRAPAVPAGVDAPEARERPRVLCLQNLLKLPPAFDTVLAQILAASGAELVLFDRSAGISRRYLARLSQSLARQGLDPANCVRIDRVRPYAEFLANVRQADLVLDSPGFSGGGTSLDALGVGTPVLAFDGRFARGRQTAAMLRLLDVPQLIAADDADYVAKAVALLADEQERAMLRRAIESRRDALFHDAAVLPAFEAFLLRAAQAAAEQGAD
ncbi:MAG TPA: tetratricopeptide repeat protein [Tahibacter sp.]|uniref:tetratricopeptide repeat protein n=1 Tax=Tahibacter sp. TaxID=2056211 RepID=UPI002C9EEE7A|nr:tetratricopeptide repeat protein [Tahibacter sp.]HSX62971.1 tetratricopeptide repeat protein [Tahibacter sp.]